MFSDILLSQTKLFSIGATTRLLVDYPEPQRSDILDYLFLPNFGASLQVLKVEIGGDSQSTDGTEPSHMHSKDKVDLHSGYEWWLMVEAKKRNKDIKLYGLPWAFPGWVGVDPATGKQSHNPFAFPEQTTRYILEWIKGARHEYGLEIDYLGVWNERGCDPAYVIKLRQELDRNGFNSTQLVVKDGDMGVCDVLHKNPEYARAVDIIGLHYPSDYTKFLGRSCLTLNKPVWSAEESSSYDDVNGAACWARVMNSHFVLSNMTSSLMWNLVGSYYHGLNWYASSMLTAVQPWSGHYGMFPVVWTTAHVTQFTKVGWKYLPVGSGSGTLPKGGFYTTIVDPNSKDFTIQIVKISHDHARCTRPPLPKPPHPIEGETVRIRLHPEQFKGLLDPNNAGEVSVEVWQSNFEITVPFFFRKQKQLTLSLANPEIELFVRKGDYYTISTVKTARRGSHSARIPASSPQFPLPYADDFQGYAESSEAKYLADQIGSFEIHSTKGGKVLRQMAPMAPIAWADSGRKGPMTVIGMREWQDVSIAVQFRLDRSNAAACAGLRVDQMWEYGVIVCILPTGSWNLTIGGPALKGAPTILLKGSADAFQLNVWQELKLMTVKDNVQGWLNGKKLFSHQIRDIDVGFAAIGTNGWFPVEYRNLKLDKAPGGRWSVPKDTKIPKANDLLVTVDCQANGLIDEAQDFELLSSWLIRHNPSGLCVAGTSSLQLVLRKCDQSNPLQQFRNDYTRIRNAAVPLFFGGNRTLLLGGSKDGQVKLVEKSAAGFWTKWAYFPNSRSIRNQYLTSTTLGFPKCLSTSSSAARKYQKPDGFVDAENLLQTGFEMERFDLQGLLCPLMMLFLLYLVASKLRDGRHARINEVHATRIGKGL